MYHCAVENPIAIALGEENISALLDPIQDLTTGSSANSLGRQKSGAITEPRLDQ